MAVVDGAHDQHAPQLEGDHSPRPGAVTEFLDDPEMWVSNEISISRSLATGVRADRLRLARPLATVVHGRPLAAVDSSRGGDARLDEILHEPGDVLHYLFDYGDSWELTLRLEGVRPGSLDSPSAEVTDGRRAAPPEDSGGSVDADSLSMGLDDPPRSVRQFCISSCTACPEPRARSRRSHSAVTRRYRARGALEDPGTILPGLAIRSGRVGRGDSRPR
ncbi:MAG: hypothetical protein WKF73_22130 [Nocardioidaceae bacterium]